MGRYGPPAFVTDRSGELLAAALQQASSSVFGGIERGRERRHQSELEAQQREDAMLGLELSHPGLHRPGNAAVPTGQGNALASALPAPTVEDGPPIDEVPADFGFGRSLAAALPLKPSHSGRGSPPIDTSPASAAPVQQAAPAPVAGHPGAFDPATGAFRNGRGVPMIGNQPAAPVAPTAPRVRQLSGGWTMNDDEADAAAMRPKELERAFADRQKADERSRQIATLRRAHPDLTEEKAGWLVDNPSLQDNEFFPPTTKTGSTTSAEWLRGRITELMKGGMTLEKANTQARLEAGQASPTTATQLSPNQIIQRTQSLMGKFNQEPLYKNATEVAQALDKVRAAASEPSAAGDLSLIFAYMKMLDPGSVVREGEFANAQNAAGIPDRVRNLYNKAMSGERLNEAQRKDFIKQAESVAGAQRKRLAPLLKRYSNIAKRHGIDPGDVIFDPFDDLPDATTSGGSAKSGPPNPWRP